MDTLASRYATALLLIAKENNQNTLYRNIVKELITLFSDAEDLKKVLNSSFISKNEKKSLLEIILKEVEIEYIRDFILLIFDNGRISHLDEILKEFVSLSNNEDNIVEGIVYSTIKLNNDEIANITNSIEQKIDKKIYLYNKIDSTLIGGIKVVIDNYIFDGSIKNKLKELKQYLQEDRAWI